MVRGPGDFAFLLGAEPPDPTVRWLRGTALVAVWRCWSPPGGGRSLVVMVAVWRRQSVWRCWSPYCWQLRTRQLANLAQFSFHRGLLATSAEWRDRCCQ
jgi:hypothetical protein